MSGAQSAAQRAFLRVEGLLNRAFGDRLNPFYHLGALAYFQFWIATVSGLYLYAFFETSVTDAYASVEAITVGQRWAGGVMRSLHRYSSDGMVVAMLLHLARHFSFGHHRGFRWFSWVTGVVLLWLVYITGINGYMLPWDRLAQFVVTASTEWLDTLPLFDGQLARNFLHDGAVSDRLFSLLSFLHIGLPLGVLAALWIHTQRVAKARTQPPLPLALSLLGALLALSLVEPAVSQARAELATLPSAIAMDWFYLPALPLVYAWGPRETWALVIGATVLMLALPWIGRRARGATQFVLSVHPDERIVVARAGETLLEAGLREGLPMPFDCRNGGCGVCKGRVLDGEVSLGAYQEGALDEKARAAGEVLMCCARPLGDVELEYLPVPGAPPAPVRRHGARVVSLELLAPDVMRILLEVDEGGRPRWHAGQYVNILLEDGAKRAFSFATAPRETGPIEMHVRRVPGGRFSTRVFEGMKPGDRIAFEGPLGAFHLREDSAKPILFVAGSTGFAPVKSMLEHAFAAGSKRPMVLYWGARTRADLYAADLASQWARDYPNFTFIPVLSESRAEDAWTGRTGLVHEAILADYPDLSRHQVYACGSVQMVEAVAPALASRGLSPDDCFSDAFHLAPRLRGDAADVVRLGGRA
ncbi:cytochrome b N-terminal domain-containing protein [Usitatibacter palustris]|uniref:Na(+)-translocating NADH-quinone reductase subunit F n=1 Tax=Usitatibacter palustris TaxID=2732487 RepID=A0A6M4H799_9PROT|nr:cytochrome b N-terminal domain-containing protein [Usitatibacter palustris]QJR14254.1 Na(+)-translocating NADH-quinone reductase subunit F [Usitatibacter palustris]